MSSLLVLGANAFSAQSLLPRLLARGHEVHAVARTALTSAPHPQLHWHEGSLEDTALLRRLLPSCHALVHLASATTPGTSARTPTREGRENLAPTLQLIELLQEHPNVHVLYASSGGAIYGNPDSSPVNEEALCRPISYYGAAKLAAESFLRALHALNGGKVTILRPSNFYGPGQGHRHGFGLIRTILERVRNRQVVEIWGDGNAVRDFLFIDDFADACIAALERPASTAPFATYNVGTGKGYSINAICSIIEEISGSALQRSYRPARSSDVREIILETTLISRELGWTARTDIRTGIDATWQWLQSPTR